MIDRAERDKRHRTELERAAAKGATLDQPAHRQQDKRLTSWLGMAMFAHMTVKGSSDREIMSAFAVGPIDLMGARERVGPCFEGGSLSTTQNITFTRQLYVAAGAQAVQEWTRWPYPDERVDWPVAMTRSKWATLNAIQRAHVAVSGLQIEQHICVY